MIPGEARGLARALVATSLIALAVMLPGLGNRFAYDDVPVIQDDAAIHSVATALPRAFAPYFNGQMLRPVPLIGFALQWSAGHGSPVPFRLMSLALYGLVCGLVVVLCRRAGASPAAALLGGVLFTVHPLHAEVTANGVGQAELETAVFVLLAAILYLRIRAAESWRTRDTAALVVLLLLATHTKESGYVLPGLLVVLELLVVRDARPWPARLAVLREPALGVVAAVMLSLAVRYYRLGELGGGMPHGTLVGLGIGERTVAVLGLVPQWFRLLLWPAHLQAEYGPPGLDAVPHFGGDQLLGILLLLGSVGVLIVTWRRSPLVAAGIAWVGIAVAPVSNIPVATPLLLAERSFFLPSIGLALVAAGVHDLLRPRLAGHPLPRMAALGGASLVLVLAGVRSAERQPVWHDTLRLVRTTVEDAPDSYRAFFLLGRTLAGTGDVAGAEAAFRRAGELWDRDPQPYEELGQLLRAQGRCSEAVPVLRRGVAADSTADTARSRLVECLIVERRWDEAEAVIAGGVAQGVTAYEGALARIAAGRAAAAASP